MNPNNPFAVQQSGLFQMSSNNSTGAFQSQQPFQFGQASGFSQTSGGTGQNTGFGQPSAFGQSASVQLPSVLGQSSGFSQMPAGLGPPTSGFGQPSSGFGQPTSVLSQSVSVFGQASPRQSASVFGQTSGSGQPTSVFGQTSSGSGQTTSVFGQASSGSGQPASVFGQASSGSGQPNPVFGQTSSGSGQLASVFGHATSVPGQPTSVFGQAGSLSGQPTSVFGQTSLGSGQPTALFGQAASVPGQPTSVFGQATSMPGQQVSVFGQASSVPGQPNSVFGQVVSAPVQPAPAFGQTSSGSGQSTFVFGQTSSVPGQSTSGFGQTSESGATLTTASSAPSDSQSFTFKTSGNSVGFTSSVKTSGASSRSEMGFKPVETTAVKPTFGASSDPVKSQSQTSATGFTFSQPAATSAGSNLAPSSSQQASSIFPSSFSFTVSSKNEKEEEKPGSGPAFVSSLGRASALEGSSQGSKMEKQESDAENRSEASTSFGSFPKGQKRKEGSERSPQRPERDLLEEQQASSRTEHLPIKRQAKGSRVNLFSRIWHDVVKSSIGVGRPSLRETRREEIPSKSGDTERPSLPGTSQTGLATHRPAKKEEETKEKKQDESVVKTPAQRDQRNKSMDSLGGVSPSELTALQCKNIPLRLNQKEIIRKHFQRYGKVQKVYCRPHKNLAIVHFCDHASARKAKRRGKKLSGEEIMIFWHKKKTTPEKKEFLPKDQKEWARDPQEKHSSEEQNFQLSPHRGSLSRIAAVGSSFSKGSPVKKLGIAKSLHFEESQESGSEGQASECSVPTLPSSLAHLISMVAETAEDKYRLLDQRDKIMRQARVKRTDLEKAKVFVGTCPDMCPEKERYMRETRNQLSIYELIPGTDKVDHAASVKEYSRSSADQEEPLPHELRPPAILNMTMNYLILRIMDQGEGNFRDWYDFVWNRTRGIRKDITQQHLCSLQIVTLIEKCTRFHIHCAHRLCEEPMSSFDAKINNENMTKCLQTLKEMYQDLANKEVYCLNEAEFRGYSVLLNLNRGDILREVQQFCPAIRNSPEVKFAVQAFTALNSNNFVRFFKLVQAATYLSACILHRYFNQVRRDSLRALNIAFTLSSQRPTSFPLDNLVRMLLFKDSEEAMNFVSCYGLNVSEGSVELNRMAFLEPETPLFLHRSVLIEQKQNVLVGEVVNGGPLPPAQQHQPICSFNSQNKYKGESLAPEPAHSSQKPPAPAPVSVGKPEDKSLGQVAPAAKFPVPTAPPVQLQPLAPCIIQPEPPVQPPPPKPQPVYSDEAISEVVQELVQDVLKGELEDLAKAGTAYCKTALSVSGTVVEELLNDVTGEILGQVSKEELKAERERIEEEKRRIEEARRRQERELFITRYSQALCKQLAEEVLAESVKDIANTELQCAVEEDRTIRITICSEEVSDSLLDQTLEEEIFQTGKETLQELQCFCKYLKRWREVVAARKQLKRQMRVFPAAPAAHDLRCNLQALAPSASITQESLAKGVVNLGHAGSLEVSCTRLLHMRQETIHKMKVQYFYEQLLCDAAWAPLDLPSLIAETFPSPSNRIFWKMILLLPSCEEPHTNETNRVLAEWLKAKFRGDGQLEDETTDPEDKLQTLALYSSSRTREGQPVNVHVCIKVACGPLSEDRLDQTESQKDLLGTSGLVMLLLVGAGGGDVEQEDVYWLSALLQLKQLLQAKPFRPAVPLLILFSPQGEEAVSKDQVEEGLMLQDLVAAKLISEYHIVEMPGLMTDLHGANRVSQSVKWLVSHCPSSVALCSRTLLQYLEDGLCNEFNDRFYTDKIERQVAGLPSQDPHAVIELYNSVLDFLAEVASSEELCDLSWPISEFVGPGSSETFPHLQWNTAEHLAWLRKAVLSFKLPEMDRLIVQAPWNAACRSISQYVSQIATSLHTQTMLISQVECLLNRVYTRWMDSEAAAWGDNGPSAQEIPWDDLLTLCINHRLRDWKPPGSPLESGTHLWAGCPDQSQQKQPSRLALRSHVACRSVMDFTKALETRSPSVVDSAHTPSAQNLSPQCLDDTFEKGEEESHRLQKKPSYSTPESLVARRSLTAIKKSLEMELSSIADITHTLSAEELLPQRLQDSIEKEKKESEKFEEQLQQWLSEDPLKQSFPFPVYLPQSLVSIPEAIPVPFRTSPSADLQGKNRSKLELSDQASETTVPISDQLKKLDRLIKTNKEEDLACELHLSALLDMVDT
nr:PREDICTED: germinal-center associated nuclear protein [Latimeria chalumnae]|eukprot:XP_005997746.1 PREDICTED: germinal-center associated nuclear protein [Latimeria chalumnae]